METLKSGCLAYWDTIMYGLIKCKVISITRKSGFTVAKIKLTVSRGPYKAGEILEELAHNVPPRKSIKGTRILQFKIERDQEAKQ